MPNRNGRCALRFTSGLGGPKTKKRAAFRGTDSFSVGLTTLRSGHDGDAALDVADCLAEARCPRLASAPTMQASRRRLSHQANHQLLNLRIDPRSADWRCFRVIELLSISLDTRRRMYLNLRRLASQLTSDLRQRCFSLTAAATSVDARRVGSLRFG